MATEKTRILIMGAAGRDFHNFNVLYRENTGVEVVAFTATQIPNIEGRVYPPELSGSRYPDGIQIHPEDDLERLIKEHNVDVVTLAYSDLPHEFVMHQGARVNAAGADFVLLSPKHTMVPSNKPVIAVCAVRTGCGKSQTSRRVSQILKDMGKKVAVIRHPMPYGDLTKQICQRFATLEDMDKHECTIEEREEYEPHVRAGSIVFAGIDYEEILRQAEKEADVILWDGGNNDTPFYKPDLHITVADPHRPGHELRYYPGETNLRMADLIVINKVDTAQKQDIDTVLASIKQVNPNATVMQANSPVIVADAAAVKGKKVLVIEDGPTLTHGEMRYGAGHVAARQLGAAEIVDPRPYAQGSIKSTFEKYNHLTDILPAMGYSDQQLAELQATIDATPCDLVLVATPIDLGRILKINKPASRVLYELDELDRSLLPDAIAKAIKSG